MRFLIFTLIMVWGAGFSQCPVIPIKLAATAGGCIKGTAITNAGSANAGVRYADGSLASTGTPRAGFSRYNFSMTTGPSGADTLRICGNSKVELANSSLGVIIIEFGSTLLLTNTSYSGAVLVNYGTLLLHPTGSPANFNLNSPSIMYNASFTGVINSEGTNIVNSASIVNYGFIKNVDEFKVNNSAATTCMGDLSVISVATLNNVSGTNAFTATTTGVGCVQYSTATSNKCLTADGTAASNTHIEFCRATGATATFNPATTGGCTTAGTGFGVGVVKTNCSACSSPLPVTLSAFEATTGKEGVLLTWATTSRWSSAYFIVERSTNGKDWFQVGIVQSDGDSEGLKHYNFTDYNPASGLSYYRLSEIDIKGNKLEYAVKEVYSERDFTSFSIHPNPTSGNLTVKINGEPNTYQFEVFDLTGKIIAKRKLSSGPNYLEDIFTSSGVYIAKLKVGTDYYTQKIVVQ